MIVTSYHLFTPKIGVYIGHDYEHVLAFWIKTIEKIYLEVEFIFIFLDHDHYSRLFCVLTFTQRRITRNLAHNNIAVFIDITMTKNAHY